jgi:hypothetical protein
MPTKKDPRDKTGTIIHAVANRVLRDHTAKNIYGNVLSAARLSITTIKSATGPQLFVLAAPSHGNCVLKD